MKVDTTNNITSGVFQVSNSTSKVVDMEIYQDQLTAIYESNKIVNWNTTDFTEITSLDYVESIYSIEKGQFPEHLLISVATQQKVVMLDRSTLSTVSSKTLNASNIPHRIYRTVYPG